MNLLLPVCNCSPKARRRNCQTHRLWHNEGCCDQWNHQDALTEQAAPCSCQSTAGACTEWITASFAKSRRWKHTQFSFSLRVKPACLPQHLCKPWKRAELGRREAPAALSTTSSVIQSAEKAGSRNILCLKTDPKTKFCFSYILTLKQVLFLLKWKC